MEKKVIYVLLWGVIFFAMCPVKISAKESKAFQKYQDAVKTTMASGSWTEELKMTIDMKISDGSIKTKEKATMSSYMDISGYEEDDWSNLKMSGLTSMSVMNQQYEWRTIYENGIAHYEYTKPKYTSVDLAIDPDYFDFNMLTQEYIHEFSTLGKRISFTIPGEDMKEVGIAAVNMIANVDDLDYSDVDVTATIDKSTGTIDNILMTFHASFTFQGYDAEADYTINYRFISKIKTEIHTETSFVNKNIEVGETGKIKFSLLSNGNVIPIEKYTLDISDQLVVEVEESEFYDDSLIITILGKAVGVSDVVFKEMSTGEEYTITVTVTSDNDSEYMFEDDIRQEWIKQHMEYAESDEYEAEIVKGYNGRLQVVFQDALDDGGVISYRLAKATSKILDLDFEFSESEMYELILAQILSSRSGLETGGEAYAVNFCNAVKKISKILIDMVNGTDNAFKIPQDTLDNINELYSILTTLSVDSKDFEATYLQFIKLFKENMNETDLVANLKKDAAFTALGIVADGVIESYDALEDIFQYAANYIAYQATSQQLRDVFNQLMVVVFHRYDGMKGVAQVIEELGVGYAWTWSDFMVALDSVANTLVEYEEEGAIAVATHAVERVKEAESNFEEKAFKSLFVLGMDTVLSKIPVVNNIVLAKNILKEYVFLFEIFTNVNEREYAVGMLAKLYCISVALDKTVDNCAQRMAEDDFYSTTVFNEAVEVYKATQLMASDYAIKYTEMVMANATAMLLYDEESNRNMKVVKELEAEVRWYSNHKKALEEQKKEIEEIVCHNPNIQYDANSDSIVYSLQDLKIHIIACPVDVAVINDKREQIAYLSSDGNTVSSGYESYFYTIKMKDDFGEVIKVAIVPDGYEIELLGKDKGIMNAFVAEYVANGVNEVEAYFDIPVQNGSKGYFKSDIKESGESGLVMDDIVYKKRDYSDTEHGKNVISYKYIAWIIVGVCVIGSVVFITYKKRRCRK